ncbi:MAG: hypothetical protein KDA53_13440 [Hyphomonas sp.]|nr:hypothetical protein [Hyphomonas sp.]
MSRPVPADLIPYAKLWQGWVNDPLIAKAGITFDRTPSGPILAPAGQIRLCAYHIDFDERPTCYQDVGSLDLALRIVEHFSALSDGWNVDYVVAFDETGEIVGGGLPY